MKHFGEVNLRQNYLRSPALPLDTSFPVLPTTGQLVFKNRVLYICVEIAGGIPVWVPLTNEITAHSHFQTVPAAQWVVSHPLNTAQVSVTVYDDDTRVVIPAEIQVTGPNTVLVDFAEPVTGKVVVLTGHFDGQVMPSYAYEHYQTVLSDTWTVTHGLGRYPIVRVFIGNQEVQPASITFDSLDIVTITFTTPQVGQVKLI